MVQTTLYRVSHRERKRESLCSLCRGIRRLCGKSVCPILIRAATLVDLGQVMKSEVLFGASPPTVFLGSYGYPRILAGPLVPPLGGSDTSLMDLPEAWADKRVEDILRYRLSLVRGKSEMDVGTATKPDKLLSTMQEAVMAQRSVDMELRLTKKPDLGILLSPRAPPMGPSGMLESAVLAENPAVPRHVEKVVSDTDLKARDGVLNLYEANLSQTQVTRIFSVGLLGMGNRRRLVPTEWSITAIDDILGRSLWKQILGRPWINRYLLFGHEAFGNNVQVLLLPSSYMFEALEAWLISENPTPASDYEFEYGRSTYAHNLEGAYYAARLPVLEYLNRISKQAGAIVLLEVHPEWIPLGVWRFREICRQALAGRPVETSNWVDAVESLGPRLRLPLRVWLEHSTIAKYHLSQTRITSFLGKGTSV